MMDSVRSPPSMGGGGASGMVGGGGGGACNDHIVSWLSSHHTQTSGRQTISSPLATLSMSSNLEDGGGSGGGAGGGGAGAVQQQKCGMKRKLSDSGSLAVSQEDEAMEKDHDSEMEEELIPTSADKEFSSVGQTMSS